MLQNKAVKYDPIVASTESTVVAVHPLDDDSSAQGYQTETELEEQFLSDLQSQGYEYLIVRSEQVLVDNLRLQLERLNQIEFSDAEWEQFFNTSIAGATDGIEDKTLRIQKQHLQLLRREDGTTKNIALVDKDNVHNNRLQVINQYAVDQSDGARRSNRYDVTILVNGLPMVHVELKKRSVDIREAFNQINRYQRDSFWAGSGLFEYVQLFVISNGTLTKYYSNTTRYQHVEETQRGRSRVPGSHRKKDSNSFEFTSWWTDINNKRILDLRAFTKTFFARHSLLNILTRYCVLTVDNNLMVMRPYQIAATEQIMERIAVSTNYNQLGKREAGGYIWHTTGSGKTLTSFKAAQLIRSLNMAEKVLFVVDRKDLDYQTMKEYDSFEQGAANSNESTAVLTKQLGDDESKIIITTIQKLANFVGNKKNKSHPVFDQHVVMIFDECHRSQFGKMHAEITRSFKKYNLFGFTGTPIMSENAGDGPLAKTTDEVFGKRLHTYTIADAIDDKNVLPFRVEYHDTAFTREDAVSGRESAVEKVTEEMLATDARIEAVTRYILEHFDQKTKRTSQYMFPQLTNISAVVGKKAAEIREEKQMKGFNALFAVASIDAAKKYYLELRNQQETLTPDKKIKVATIFSYAQNQDSGELASGQMPEEGFDTDRISGDDRMFLEGAVDDYNAMFGTSYDVSPNSFQSYYKDVSMRMKNRELDLLVVVNMFLTGFDAKTLNTLFVDKNLRYHGLLQAYSRTNRILNSVKSYGNIVSFRDLHEETNKALTLFGNKDALSVALMKPYRDYVGRYQQLATTLLKTFPPGSQMVGEQAKKDFVMMFGEILQLHNVLTSFDEFVAEGSEDNPLSPRQMQDYQSQYLDIYRDMQSRSKAENDDPGDDNGNEGINGVTFEIELIKQVEINVDYILMLVERYREQLSENTLDLGEGDDKADIKAQISRAVDASPSLRGRKDLIEAFLDTVTDTEADIDEQWRAFIVDRKNQELESVIATLKLKPEETRVFMHNAFRDDQLRTGGTDINAVMRPVSRFGGGNRNQVKKDTVETLSAFFERFSGL